MPIPRQAKAPRTHFQTVSGRNSLFWLNAFVLTMQLATYGQGGANSARTREPHNSYDRSAERIPDQNVPANDTPSEYTSRLPRTGESHATWSAHYSDSIDEVTIAPDAVS